MRATLQARLMLGAVSEAMVAERKSGKNSLPQCRHRCCQLEYICLQLGYRLLSRQDFSAQLLGFLSVLLQLHVHIASQQIADAVRTEVCQGVEGPWSGAQTEEGLG